MVSLPNSVDDARLPPDTILVAEDAPDVRRMMTDLLARVGYDVRGAVNGLEALAVAASLSRLDLLVTDVSMPGMDGVTLAEHLRSTKPLLRVLFVSGGPQGLLPVELPPRSWFLAKPFGVSAFLWSVGRALDDRRHDGVSHR